ncbi:MAG: hypothetical protein V3S89_12510 [Desulfobacterales bacterium]
MSTTPHHVRRWMREPFLLFVLAGALIFLLDLTIGKQDPQQFRIDVTDGEIKRLAELWRVQMGLSQWHCSSVQSLSVSPG